MPLPHPMYYAFCQERLFRNPRKLTMKPLKPFQFVLHSGPALLLPLVLALAGCVSVRVHRVGRTVIAPHVLDASLDQLISQMNARYSALQTINASVEISATTGGVHEGEVKEIPTFAGYILLRKPGDLHLILLLPVIRSRAFDMVTDGKTFKLLIPPKNRAITGSDEIVEAPVQAPAATPAVTAGTIAGTTPGATQPEHQPSALEGLRPSIIREALQVPALAADEFVTLTQHSRILPPKTSGNDDHRETIEEPDYDLTVLRRVGVTAQPSAVQTVETVRVIHIGRIDLLPYQQDIYDHHGRVVTEVYYNKYAKSGDLDFPMNVLIKRPLDEYTLNIVFTKLQLNTKLDDEQFVLKIPDNIPIQKM